MAAASIVNQESQNAIAFSKAEVGFYAWLESTAIHGHKTRGEKRNEEVIGSGRSANLALLVSYLPHRGISVSGAVTSVRPCGELRLYDTQGEL